MKDVFSLKIREQKFNIRPQRPITLIVMYLEWVVLECLEDGYYIRSVVCFRINADPTLLPDIKLGVKILDTCRFSTKQHTLFYVSHLTSAVGTRTR